MVSIKQIWSVLKHILILLSFIIVFLVFSWWGILGYMVFVLLLAGYILYNKWDSYQAITNYGANELLKVFGRKKDGNVRQKNKKTKY